MAPRPTSPPPRSFKEASLAFKKESYINELEGMSAQLDTERGFVDNLLYYSAADSDPGRCAAAAAAGAGAARDPLAWPRLLGARAGAALAPRGLAVQ